MKTTDSSSTSSTAPQATNPNRAAASTKVSRKKTSTQAAKTPAQAPTKKAVAKVPAKRTSKASPSPLSKVRAAAKPASAATPTKATPVKAAKPVKEKKVKVIRDSFSIPKDELGQINDMKKRAMSMGVSVKKSELIRAGLQALSTMADAGFKKALASVPTIKTGRPAKD